MFKTVLFPIDKSREAREAVEVVNSVVKTYGSQLFLLSVVEKPPEEGDSVMSHEEIVAKLLDEAKKLFAQSNIEAEIIEKEGIPSFTICDVAEEIKADLIIMGCRGLGLTTEGAEESVTNRVTNLAPCPVLVVP